MSHLQPIVDKVAQLSATTQSVVSRIDELEASIDPAEVQQVVDALDQINSALAAKLPTS